MDIEFHASDTSNQGPQQNQMQASIIDRLPSDLLVEIFSIIAKGHPEFASAFVEDDTEVVGVFGANQNSTSTLVDVSHVCRRWRSCAIERPSLWTLITSDYSKTKSEIFLQRSKAAFLSVIYAPSERSWDFGSLIKNELPRIQHLKIIDKSWPIARGLLLSPAPRLKFLELNMGDTRNHEGCYFLPPLFTGVSPNLAVLKLQYCAIDWKSQVFQNLTELSIMNIIEQSSYQPKIDDLFSVLERCPDLVSFTLMNAGPVDSAISSERSNRAITLPRLKHLYLMNMDSNICSKFLKRLSFTDININWKIFFNSTTYHYDHDANVHIVPRILDNTLQCRSLVFFFEGLYAGIQGFKANSEKADLFQLQNKNYDEIDTTTDELCRHFHQIVREGYWHTAPILTVRIQNSGFELDGGCWKILLGTLSSLQHLTVTIENPVMDAPLVTALFNILGHHSDFSQTLQSDDSLDTLGLSFLFIIIRYQGRQDEYDSSVVSAILECLQSRKEYGLQFKFLELPFFRFSAGSRSEIESLVDVVRWTE